MFEIPFATIESSHKKVYKQFLKEADGEKQFDFTNLLEKFTQNQEELKICQKENARLEKWKKKEEDKKEAAKLRATRTMEPNPYLSHKFTTETNSLLLNITRITSHVYGNFPYSGKEHHYQAALEAELREAGYMVQQELATQLHYKKLNGEIIQLPHDIRGREDLLLPRQKLIIELKQTGKLTEKEFKQIGRYMHERNNHTDWGTDTHGLLINFGDNDLEIWYLYYDKQYPETITGTRLKQTTIPPLSDFMDLFHE